MTSEETSNMKINRFNLVLASTILLGLLSFVPVSIAQDTTPPVIEFTSMSYSSEYAYINITARVSDNVGVSSVLCLDLDETIGGLVPGSNHTMVLLHGDSLNGTYLYQPPAYPWPIETKHAIYIFFACDTSGNWASTGVNGYLFRITKESKLQIEAISLEEPTGGDRIPVDKLGLLSPYIGLTSAIIVATVVAAIYVNRIHAHGEKEKK
jgi:hypothetical protein